ncbi:hypothetical protein PFICI_01049 [Pestalotiopsis fici W106-1]|uniref:Uncharacterized protein n=1 Tax=Pestalotiopsis fici (strain W106-1 / CGMCC3.15140) TaxID=1229662 RepID=W3XPR3_PESFW|nr:uncharacterized protein PFICI_01049 [Pestalotiopsis fici W106-1]ETS87221.1 hypothetical protein PFICI_01049 [Pestalotiopsis fici W106-1]
MTSQQDKSNPVASEVAREAAPVQPGDLPPSYEDTVGDTAGPSITPNTLMLSGHHVVPVSAANYNPQPLYELNRGVAVCTNATRSITFSRLDHEVRHKSDGQPVVKERKRHLYDLERPHSLPLVGKYSESWPSRSSGQHEVSYWCRSRSRQTFGDVGLRLKSSFLSSRSSAQVVRVKPEGGESEGRAVVRETKEDEAQSIFTVEWKKKEEFHTWKDENGNQVALEIASDTEHKLEVTSILKQEMLDVLVAAWCLRIWLDSVLKHERDKDMLTKLGERPIAMRYSKVFN